MSRAIFSLMIVCLVDVMGQGLAFPIFDVLLLKPGSGFLAGGTSQSHAEFLYGVAIGTFFLTWFFGSIYIARLSDSIGRKLGIVICLLGAIAGYALAAIAIIWHSYSLLVASRAITGFTAGAQPIAAAAMIDLAASDREGTRNLGLATAGMSFGLVIGPIIGGVFSDQAILGLWASPQLPFVVGGILCFLALVLIIFSFQDVVRQPAPLVLNPLEIVKLLTQALDRRSVLRVTAVYFPYMLCLLALYVFASAYLTARFGYGAQAASLGMFLMGLGLAFSSSLLVDPLNAWLSRRTLMLVIVLLFCLVITGFVLVPSGPIALALLFPAGLLHGIGYPTLLSGFSQAVDRDEQGWVMGFSTAVFTIAAAGISFFGGELTASVGRDAPFQFALLCGGIAIIAILMVWKRQSPVDHLEA